LKEKQLIYDYVIGDNGLYNPVEGDAYIRPNGLALNVTGFVLAEFIDNFKGKYIY